MLHFLYYLSCMFSYHKLFQNHRSLKLFHILLTTGYKTKSVYNDFAFFSHGCFQLTQLQTVNISANFISKQFFSECHLSTITPMPYFQDHSLWFEMFCNTLLKLNLANCRQLSLVLWVKKLWDRLNINQLKKQNSL